MSNENTSDSPQFISLNEAAEMTKGTRITFIPGVQALYAEALKNICYVKDIPVIGRYTRLWVSTKIRERIDRRGCMN